jgi:hypothetical protein
VGEVGRSTQGGDGKELGRFMELGSYYVCVCGGLCMEVGWGLLLITIGVLDIFPGH